MIYYHTPYSLKKDISEYYNNAMSLLENDNDWCCFVDGDAMFLQPNFGHIIDQYTQQNDFGLLTCYTNRVGTGYMLEYGMWDIDDIKEHRKKAVEVFERNQYNIMDITNLSPLSGVLMLLKKETWLKAGGFTHKGMLGVDNSIHYNVRNNGMKVGLMMGLYIFHWYRSGKNIHDKSHLM